MDEQSVRRILRQIAGGNSEFDLNSTAEARMLGYEPDTAQDEAEAANLRYHLETLAREGAIRIQFVSAANNCVADLTGRGREMLRRLGG